MHSSFLEGFKTQIEKAKTAKTKAETTLEQLEKQQQDVIEEMKLLGVAPETITDEINKIEKEIEILAVEIESIISEFAEVI